MTKTARIHLLSAGVALTLAGSALAAETAPARYIVTLNPGADTAELARIVSSAKSNRVHHRFDDEGMLAATLSQAQLKALRTDPRVRAIEIDPPRYPLAQTQPYGIGMVQAPSAWSGGHTGDGVMVCVIDSGVKANHEDFVGVNIVGGYPTGWNSDACGHGTHVAGTIAAQDNTTGVVGVSPGDVSMYFVQVFSGASCGWSYASDLIDAANRCKTAADGAGQKLVINMSLGGSGSSTAEGNAFQNLYNAGVLSIAAAGNDGNSSMSYPASYGSVMSVAAIDSAKAKADFSQYNSAVEISAPGVAVLSTYPIASATTTVGGAAYTVASMEGTPQLSRSGAIVNGGRCTSAGSWSGKVVLCERGDIAFADKVVNAQNGGAVAAIIYNNAPGGFGGTLGTTSTSIPSVTMSQEDGQEIIASRLNQTAAVSTVANNNTSAYASLDGTSMASPHVAGAAAVIWSSNLNATNADVRNAITGTAEDLGTAGRDNNFGFGLIRISNAIAALAGPAPDTTPPSTVSSLSASSDGTSSINLSWSAATDTGGSGLAGYKIERCSGSTCTNFSQVATTTSISYSSTGLAEGTTYRFRVRAYDGAGNNGNYSSIASATTDTPPPPTGSVLANGVPVGNLSGATGSTVFFTMDVPAGATNLSFAISGGSGDADLYVRFGAQPTTGSYDCRPYQGGNNENCSFASPQTGTYHVMLHGYSSYSGVSLVGSYTNAPAPDTTPPSTVGGLTATSSSTSAIELSWSAASDTGGSGLAGYKIERCSGSTCTNFAQIATSTSTSYNNTGLAEGTTYRYRVRAYDGAGNNGSYSSIASATTDSTPPPTGNVLANGVPVTNLAGASGSTVTYTMDVPAGASALSFVMSGGSGDADMYVKFGSAPTTSSYDCRPYKSGNAETCSFATPQTGTYHVMIRGYSSYSGVSLVGSYTEGSGGGVQTYTNETDVSIPDNNSTGVYSNISVSGRSGNAPSNAQVSVNIVHTYIGDLIVDLVAPDGSVYNLHNRSGGSADNIVQTYTVNLSSEALNGTWRLRARDRASADTGYINSWSITF